MGFLNNKLGVYIIVVLSMLCWAMTYIWYKIVFTELGPLSVMTIRLVFSAMFMFAFSKLTKRLTIPESKDWLWFILLSFFQPFLYFLAESYGVSMVSSTISAVIISTIPVFTPFIMFLFFREKVSLFNVIGIVVSFIGVIAVILGRELHFSGSILGILLLFSAVLAALFYGVIIVKLTNKYNTFTIISWQNLIGAFFFLPLFFIYDWQNFLNANFSQKIILNLIYLALFGSSLAYVFFTFSIKKLGLVKASMFANIIPVFTAMFAYFVLGEVLSAFKWVGIFVVLFGLYMSQMNRVKK